MAGCSEGAEHAPAAFTGDTLNAGEAGAVDRGPAGMENCYVFKSRLQEYAQKVNILTPVYQTVKEGPSHEPVFKSTVIVNDVKYDSLPGFFNRKAAEQSAAEIALMKIRESGQKAEYIPTVHETGLCKNLLQEYAQKMNYAIPMYVCNKQPSGLNPYICTVEIGGIQYIGAAARTKKEAEIKAARTTLLAIRGSETSSNGSSQYTVLPGKKKATEKQAEVPKKLKPKRANFKKKWQKKFPRKKDDQVDGPMIKDEAEGEEGANTDLQVEGPKDEPQNLVNNVEASVVGKDGSSEASCSVDCSRDVKGVESSAEGEGVGVKSEE